MKYILSAVVILVIFQGKSRFVSGENRWHSYSLNLELQSKALLKGSLSLGTDPRNLFPDYIWGTSLQQNWGLGIASLRAPFQFVSDQFKISPFPNKMVFLFYFLFAIFILADGLRRAIQSHFPNENSWVLALSFTALIALSPAFLINGSSRFWMYEEVMAYLGLWSCLVLGLLLRFLSTHSKKDFYFVCIAAGCSALIRPTGIFYGTVSVLLTFTITMDLKQRLKGAVLFGAPMILILVTNKLRFGDYAEFGYSLLLTGNPFVDYSMWFGSPFQSAPWRDASRDLIKSMFFIKSANFNGAYVFENWFYSGHAHDTGTRLFHSLFFLEPRIFNEAYVYDNFIFKGQFNEARRRMFYYVIYKPADLWILGISWFFTATQLIYTKIKNGYLDQELNFLLKCSCWGGLSLTLMFFFYLRLGITSRYFLDFAPALAVIQLSLIVALQIVLRKWLKPFSGNRIAKGFLLLWPPVLVSGYIYNCDVRNIDLGHRKFMASFFDSTPSQIHQNPLILPDEYHCHHTGVQDFGIFVNNAGWDYQWNCQVSCFSSHFFRKSDCIQLQIEVPHSWNRDITQMKIAQDIRVKMGLVELALKKIAQGGDNQRVVYCLPPGKDAVESAGNIQVVSVRWSQPSEMLNPPPYHLTSIKALSK